MLFTQSGLGQRAFQAQKPCKNGIVSIDQILKQKTLSGLRLIKIRISQLLFILLRQTLRKKTQGVKKCANKQLKKLVTQWLKKLWDQFFLLCLKPNPPVLTLGYPIGSLVRSYLLRSLPKSHGQRHRTINFCATFDLCSLRLPSGSLCTSAPDAAMRFVKHIPNKLALKLHQLDWLTNLSAFWDYTVSLNEYTNLLAACHFGIIFRGVIFDRNGSMLFDN